MTHEQMQREFQYRVTMSLLKELLKTGGINEKEYRAIDTKMILHYLPVLSGLYP